MLIRTYVWVEASMASWQHPTASPPGTPSPCSVGRPARLCARFPGGSGIGARAASAAAFRSNRHTHELLFEAKDKGYGEQLLSRRR
jgi:hypothetical protein